MQVPTTITNIQLTLEQHGSEIAQVHLHKNSGGDSDNFKKSNCIA